MAKFSLEHVCWWAIMILYGSILIIGVGAMLYVTITGSASMFGALIGAWALIALIAVVINKIHS